MAVGTEAELRHLAEFLRVSAGYLGVAPRPTGKVGPGSKATVPWGAVGAATAVNAFSRTG